MKRYLTVLSLIGLAAALQTGCIVTDAPFLGDDGIGWKAQNNVSNQTLDCRTLSNEGGGNIQRDQDIAVGFLCRPTPVNPRIFNPCIQRMTAAQAKRIWGYTGTGITDQQAAVMYYGIGANTLGYEYAPNGIPEIGVNQPAYILRTSTVPSTRNPQEFEFGCSQTYYNFAALPEAAERGSYGADPSVVAIDRSTGCQFFDNIEYKDASIWTTPPGGIYPTAADVPANRQGTGLKYTGALATCYDQSNGSGNTGFLSDTVIKNLGCDESVQLGVLSTLSLKTGEASCKYVVSLDEETGRMTVEIREVGVRGQSHVLTTPIVFRVDAGRRFLLNQEQLGYAEVASWLLESSVDLSKPFAVGGEYLPFAKFVAPHTQVMVSRDGLKEIVRQAGIR